LAVKDLKELTPEGFRFAGARCGLKNKRNDVGLIVSDRPTQSAGVLTTNQVRAACVDYTRGVLASGGLRAIVVNSGNANCCTGEQGVKDTATMARLAAEAVDLSPNQVSACSTGIIGHVLDMNKLERGIIDASKVLGTDPRPFMEAILTTDLVEKWAATWVDGHVVGPDDSFNSVGQGKVFGVAKGSGMIAPNMATMLSYIITDLDCSAFSIQECLEAAADLSFNCMTVDGDTSTNDTLLVLANGASGIAPSKEEFQILLNQVCVSLARQIAKDGEGATKLVEVRVRGTQDPKRIARTVAESPLVKTAMFGCDPNWGRMLMAAGKAGVGFDATDVRLSVFSREEEHLLFQNGTPEEFDPARVSAALKSDHVIIDLLIGGESAAASKPAVVYTCDLGFGYVRINAEYHT
jgi:glutamate N-acetyltransferase/amino-acid N-acetyltransferase